MSNPWCRNVCNSLLAWTLTCGFRIKQNKFWCFGCLLDAFLWKKTIFISGETSWRVGFWQFLEHFQTRSGNCMTYCKRNCSELELKARFPSSRFKSYFHCSCTQLQIAPYSCHLIGCRYKNFQWSWARQSPAGYDLCISVCNCKKALAFSRLGWKHEYNRTVF